MERLVDDMDLILLKVKHKYDAEYEEIGIFSSKEKMKQGKKDYLETMSSVPADEFTFTYSYMKLDELY